ncbi:MAG: Rrf2 family transcriptional regulator [bacterium]|nr:Rrf2 family transcriptional regulator [bacterium]
MSTRGRFSLRALLHLTAMDDGTPVSVSDIADIMDVSPDYLMQLFVKMRRNGLLKSTRGPKGGFVLSRSASEITVGDIVRSVEGEIAAVDCVSETIIGCDPEVNIENICEKAEDCVSRLVWLRLTQTCVDLFDSLTLSDVIVEAKEKGLLSAS